MERNARTASVLNLIAGIWLIISPFVLGQAAVRPDDWSNVIAGLVVLILGWIRAANPARHLQLSWINLIAGIWVFISPFVLGYANNQVLMWNDLILGVIVFVLSWVSAAQSGPIAQH